MTRGDAATDLRVVFTGAWIFRYSLFTGGSEINAGLNWMRFVCRHQTYEQSSSLFLLRSTISKSALSMILFIAFQLKSIQYHAYEFIAMMHTYWHWHKAHLQARISGGLNTSDIHIGLWRPSLVGRQLTKHHKTLQTFVPFYMNNDDADYRR